MRFKNWYPATVGDKRVECYFAWFPVKLNGETKWLERVSVEYEDRYGGMGFTPKTSWRKNRFV